MRRRGSTRPHLTHSSSGEAGAAAGGQMDRGLEAVAVGEIVEGHVPCAVTAVLEPPSAIWGGGPSAAWERGTDEDGGIFLLSLSLTHSLFLWRDGLGLWRV